MLQIDARVDPESSSTEFPYLANNGLHQDTIQPTLISKTNLYLSPNINSSSISHLFQHLLESPH
jgi:hypothetical protein